MSNKRIKLIAIIACLLLSASLIWKNCESRKTNTVVYTTNKSIATTEIYTTSENIVTKRTTTSVSTIPETEDITKNKAEEPLYINLNTADSEALCRLDGIGQKLADSIICYREENGGFKNIEEIMNIHGIGEGIFNAVRDFVYVENPVYSVSEPEQEISVDDENENEFIENISEISEKISTEPLLTLDDVAPIDLNTADIELLLLLPNVDEEIANNIIELRKNIHGFSHPYELLYTDGLSEDKVREILDYVIVENEFQE